jgi:hypothetical protein
LRRGNSRLDACRPYLNAGQPGLADIQSGTFYPFNLLPNLVLGLLDIPFSMNLLTAQVILHFSLVSLFTYLFVRHLARRTGARIPAARSAGAVAALTFTYAGYLTSFPVQQLTILETAVWLPLVLLFMDRSFHHHHPRPQILLAGMTLACALLAGHPQTAMYVVYTALAYGLFLTYSTRTSDPGSWLARSVPRFICRALPPLVLGAALAAVQLVPTLAFITRSTRASLDYDAVAWGIPLAEMTHFLYPGYFGGSPQYVGILSPILAIAAWFAKRVRWQVAFWTAAALVALVLAFGGHTFLYNIAYLLAPGFGAVRNQERIIYLFSFAVGVLAGYGTLALVQPLPRPARIGFRRLGRALVWASIVFLVLTALFYFGYVQGLQQGVEINLFEGVLRHHTLLLLILGGSAALFALRWSGQARRAWLVALALGLIWLNLFTVNWRYNLADPVAGGPFPDTGLITFLKDQPGTYRISSAGLLPNGSSAGTVYELEDITGNTPFRLDAFQRFEDEVGSWRRWQLLNVHYVLDRRDLDGPGLARVHEEKDIKVYEVGDPLPRAWIVHSTVEADDDQAIESLNAADFDPWTVAVLPPGSKSSLPPGGGRPGIAARVVEAAPGRLILDVTPGGDGLLVVSQIYYPGWEARVDGDKVPIYRTDYLLQGILVRADSRRVELSYHLPLWPAIVSLLALLACLAALFTGRRRA